MLSIQFKLPYICIMERRIKILNYLTVIVIVLFTIVQGKWLYSRYKYTVQTCADTLYSRVFESIDEYNKVRQSAVNNEIAVEYTTRRFIRGGTEMFLFDIYTADMRHCSAIDSLSADLFSRIYEMQHPDWLDREVQVIVVKQERKESEVLDAIERSCLNRRSPFSVEKLDTRMRSNHINIDTIFAETADSIVWESSRAEWGSLFHPVLSITYPYDILGKKLVRMDCPIALPLIIREMSDILFFSFTLSVLLVFCLVAQIATIRKQRKIENLRSDFIQTMIHELKRPIATLKMCVSYMGNERLMKDIQGRQMVVADSHTALDSLSALFSKLRDLTFSNATEIPLNISAFSLHDLLDTCIHKLNVPSDKNVHIVVLPHEDVIITADRMHMMNIIDNLLENAVKYSREKVEIEIDYQKCDNDYVRISVKDNGLGIPKSEHRHIFEKFYRGRIGFEKNIAGMGLGLAYVRMLVEAHRGDIHIESELNHGSSFIIELPQ
jgi:two-component system phosphate regulon sensor histidine kinase PhoR